MSGHGSGKGFPKITRLHEACSRLKQCGYTKISPIISLLFCTLLILPVFPAHAATTARIELPFGISLGVFEIIQFSIFTGTMGVALLSAGWFIRERARIISENHALRTNLTDMTQELQRSAALLNMQDQRAILWDSQSGLTEIAGFLPETSGAPRDHGDFLNYQNWLQAESAAIIAPAIIALRDHAQAFDLTLETANGALISASGRISATLAIARFAMLEGANAQQASLQQEKQQLAHDLSLLRSLFNQLDQAIWMRDQDGKLDWVNAAYAHAVEASDAIEAVKEGRELFGAQALERIAHIRQGQEVFHDRLPTVIRGDRHIFDVTDVESAHGSAGFAVNISNVEQIREELQRTLTNHAETLDQLSTAVAIFSTDMKLQFYNQAFAALWSLDTGFLDSHPSNALLFDRLRSEGKLPEQPEWRRWKDSMLSAYRAVDSQEHLWHLPDTRILRVVANPHPQGGVTWFFENMTEKFELEGRYNTLIKVQGETLDHLAEGVVVFGSDGRIRLSNPAFAKLWSLSPEMVVEGVHIANIAKQFTTMPEADTLWKDFVTAVTGFSERRDGSSGQTGLGSELHEGAILSYAVVPLPKGQTMLTFVDITDTARVERALKDKNEALQLADQIKNDFVQHVSYELRSPLTNIIGFTELLQAETVGPMNEGQREYIDHIGSSSSVLLAIVNDILDLATVDAGIMQLDIQDVLVADAIDAAAGRIKDKMDEHDIELKVTMSQNAFSFRADAGRVHQVLFNLLANAANYAPEGSTVLLNASRQNNDMIFTVHDDGPGMAKDVLDTMFKRFEAHNNGGRRRGAGLGLSLVKSFVELHGGSVEIETAPHFGTTVLCRFPMEARLYTTAAE